MGAGDSWRRPCMREQLARRWRAWQRSLHVCGRGLAPAHGKCLRAASFPARYHALGRREPPRLDCAVISQRPHSLEPSTHSLPCCCRLLPSAARSARPVRLPCADARGRTTSLSGPSATLACIPTKTTSTRHTDSFAHPKYRSAAATPAPTLQTSSCVSLAHSSSTRASPPLLQLLQH